MWIPTDFESFFNTRKKIYVSFCSKSQNSPAISRLFPLLLCFRVLLSVFIASSACFQCFYGRSYICVFKQFQSVSLWSSHQHEASLSKVYVRFIIVFMRNFFIMQSSNLVASTHLNEQKYRKRKQSFWWLGLKILALHAIKGDNLGLSIRKIG